MYDRRYEINDCYYFFIKAVITIITKCTNIRGTNVSKFRLFSHKVSFTLSTLFLSLRETLYVGRVKSLMKRQCAFFVGMGMGWVGGAKEWMSDGAESNHW